jgi:hypothetical protein
MKLRRGEMLNNRFVILILIGPFDFLDLKSFESIKQFRRGEIISKKVLKN